MMNPRLKKFLPLVIGIVGVAAFFVVYKHYYSNDKVADGTPRIVQKHDIEESQDASEDVMVGNNSNYDIVDNGEANDAQEYDAPKYEPQSEYEQIPSPDLDSQQNMVPAPAPNDETPPAPVDPEITAPHPMPNPAPIPTPQPEPIDPLPLPTPQPSPERDVERQPREIAQPVFMVIPKN